MLSWQLCTPLPCPSDESPQHPQHSLPSPLTPRAGLLWSAEASRPRRSQKTGKFLWDTFSYREWGGKTRPSQPRSFTRILRTHLWLPSLRLAKSITRPFVAWARGVGLSLDPTFLPAVHVRVLVSATTPHLGLSSKSFSYFKQKHTVNLSADVSTR